MQLLNRARLFIVASAALLATTGLTAAPALADSSPVTVPATVIVDQSAALTINTPSISFEGLAGTQPPDQPVSLTATTNDASGYDITVAATDFTGAHGSFGPGFLNDSYANQSRSESLTNAPQATDTSAAASGASGDSYTDDIAVNGNGLPSVAPGTYQSVLTFVLVPH